MNELIIRNTKISRDAYGRYSLNDLHRAAGGEKKSGPSYWLENEQTERLLSVLNDEVKITGIPVIVSKQGVGTFVIEDMVYSYAMWLSPEFHLDVIRAYRASVEVVSQPKEASLDSVTKFMDMVKGYAPNLGDNPKQALLSHLTSKYLGIDAIPLPKVETHLKPAGEVAQELGISAAMVGRLANANGIKVNGNGEFRLDKSRYSSKQVENFYYSPEGVEAIRRAALERKGKNGHD